MTTTATAHHAVITTVPDRFVLKQDAAWLARDTRQGYALDIDSLGYKGETPVVTQLPDQAMIFTTEAEAREMREALAALRFTALRIVRRPAHDITAITDEGRAAVAARRAARNADRKW